MKLLIFDYDCYDNDIGAQRVQHTINPLLDKLEGLWLYKEPDFKTDGNELPTFTIATKEKGLILIKVFSETNENLTSIEDKFWVYEGMKIKSGFQKFRNYGHKIKSLLDDPLLELNDEIPMNIYYIFPYVSDNRATNIALKKNEKIYYLDDFANISLDDIECNLSNQDYEHLINIVQNANIINKFSNFYVEEPASNMFEAIELNNKKIAKFDYDQMAASLTITSKSERIRGLAGSGKTVLLAMKAARLHKRFPDKKIAFVFYTKSLYNQATALIRKYYNQIADLEPDWEKLKVMHSWGGATTGEGFYSYVCREYGVRPKSLNQGNLQTHCKELINHEQNKELFDFILIDEAQDFPLDFFLLVEKVAKSPKKIVVAYDELQSTSDISIPSFDKLFGETNGKPNVELDPKYDFILKKSYRNTLEVLMTAFAFGFGFYHTIVQIIQDETTWEALGFECEAKLIPNNEVTINRPIQNSPNSIKEFYDSQNPVEYKTFANIDTTIDSIVNEIKKIIFEQKVNPVDIMVIDIGMNRTKTLNNIQYKLHEHDISSHIPGVVKDSREFFIEDNVTLTTPRHAKGNEVSIVFVLGCELMYNPNLTRSMQRQIRNFMFISLTRSKGWVYLAASGRVKTVFNDEITKINKHLPSFHFKFPEDKVLNELSKIDLLTNNPIAEKLDGNITAIKSTLEAGNESVLKELINLDPSLKEALKKLLQE